MKQGASIPQEQRNIIGSNISLLLERTAQSQKKLAAALRVNPHTVSGWTKGRPMLKKWLGSLAEVFTQWLGYRIRPEDLLNPNLEPHKAATVEEGGRSYDDEAWRQRMYESLERFLERQSVELAIDADERAYLTDLDYRGNVQHEGFNDDFWEAELRTYRKYLKRRKQEK